MFIKLVHQKGDVVRCEHLFEDDVKFTIDKIKSVICPISEILLVKLFDPKMKSQQMNPSTHKAQDQFSKVYYLVNQEGLRRVIKNYLAEHFFNRSTSFRNLCKVFEIEPEEEAKFLTILQDLVNQNLLYAYIVKEKNEEDHQIRFLTLFEVPQKRKKVFELMFTIIIFVVLLILLLEYTKYL
jgi:hypothetical protein